MLSRMGLVMLAGKGLLGTRTGRALVGRLGRRLARTALAGMGRTVAGTDGAEGPQPGRREEHRRDGQGGPGNGRAGGHGGGQRRGGLADVARALLSATDGAATRPVPVPPGDATAVSAGEDTTAGMRAESAADWRRAAALEALEAHMVSFINGRARLRHPALRLAAVHAPLRDALAQAGCFTALTFSARTGSLLLEYDGSQLSRADFCAAALPLGWFLARCDAASRA